MEKERWREIPGFDDYFVSSRGRIRSFKRKSNGKLLKPGIRKDGYLFVNIHGNNGVQSVLRIQTLVCLAFIGSQPKGLWICHKDGDRKNNRLENLRYDTPKGNGKDTIAYNLVRKGYSKTLNAINSKQKYILKRYLLNYGMEMYFLGTETLYEIAQKLRLEQQSLSRTIRKTIGYIDLRSLRYVRNPPTNK